ncbi:MAG: LacI family DNA-binding transcriptional regulator [Ruminococcus sp.]|jgi:DNA-binding LacI/PurR family transcriptional regulator
MKCTIRDIAKMAGTSPSSVSLVLNNKPGVRKEMRQRITRLLLENGYTLKSQEKAETSEVKRICFIYYKSSNWIARRKDNFLLRILEGIESACQKLNCEYSMVNANYEDLEKVLQDLTKEKVDGVIFLGTEYAHDSEKLMVNGEVPFLCIDHYFDEENFDCVNIDNLQSHYQSIRHLMGLGHKKIGYLTSNLESGALQNRKEAFCSVMSKLGLKVWPEHIIYLSLLQDEAEESLEQYLETFQELPTAFIACNDVMAIAAVGMLQRAGYRVPEDISVIGFDDSGVCEMIVPRLTTIHADLERMGSLAVERLRQVMDNKTSEVLKMTIGTRLVCRETTGPARE